MQITIPILKNFYYLGKDAQIEPKNTKIHPPLSHIDTPTDSTVPNCTSIHNSSQT
jgi:hypothetical protein